MITSMKKLNLLIGTFALAATIVSCSSDEVVVHQDNAPGITNQSIGFSPLSRAVSRSNVLSQTSDMSSFRVMGFWAEDAANKMYIQGIEKDYTTGPGTTPTAGSAYEGFGTYTSNGQTGIEIVQRSGGAWDYKNSSEIQYWPFSAVGDPVTSYDCAKLNFKAVTPASSDLDLAADTYGYTTPAVASMEDICYATISNQTNVNSPVTLTFNHLFSQIVFNAKRPDNYEVQIKEIEIGGVKTQGQYTNLSSTPFAVTATGNTSKFQGFTTASEYIEVGRNATDTALTVQITPAKSELLLLPQTVEKWTKDANATSPEDKPSTSAKGTIKIVYRARIAGATSWATAAADGSTTYATVYYPISATWEAGKKYVYALLFGGVTNSDPGEDGDDPDDGPYDEDGNIKPQAIPITFSATVSDWTTTNVDVEF